MLRKLNFKKIISYVIISVFVFLAISLLLSYFTKTEDMNIYSNKVFVLGTLYDIGNAGRGTTMGRYKFRVKNKTYKGAISLATFDDSDPRIGKNYIVAYNLKNPSQNICFLNLEVHDSIRHYFANGSLSQLPIESYQRSVDSFFLKSLTGGLTKYPDSADLQSVPTQNKKCPAVTERCRSVDMCITTLFLNKK